MIYDHKHYDQALSIALEVHHGVVRRDGTPYITHPIRVAARVHTLFHKIVALLHDVVEDSDNPVYYEKLIRETFGDRVGDVVMLVTRDKENETYEEFIRRLATDYDAILIKRADIFDNTRSAIDARSMSLQKRYDEADYYLFTVIRDNFSDEQIKSDHDVFSVWFDV